MDSIEKIHQTKKPSKSLILKAFFFSVIPLAQNSNSLLEDLRRLNQLKDSPYKNDFSQEKSKVKGMKL